MIALITGATAGIGESTSRLLWKNGYSVVLTGRRRERLDLLKTNLLEQKKTSGQFVEVFDFDIQDSSQVENFIQKNLSLLSGIEVLVNNAGLAKGSDKLQEAHLADLDQMIDTNVKGLLYITRGILPFMLSKKSGHIVNIGSVAGRWTYQGGAVYCATKFAVRALSEGLRQDVAGSSLRVTNIEPGMVETEFSEVRFQDKEKAKKVYQGMKPLSASDIAETILWCLQRPGHVNIQELVIYPTDQAAIGMVHRV
jgi:3-hydroxy acid dehydrogenase/malonic semialdehyde reductase